MYQLQCEGQCSSCPRIPAPANLSICNLGCACARFAAECRVRCEAILTAVAVRNRDRDQLAELRWQRAVAQCAERAKHALEGGGRIRRSAKHCRHGAEGV